MADVKQVASGATLESIGTVKTVVGTVKAVDQSGAERILQAGDKVFANETIVTADGGLVLIEFADGSHLDLASASQIILDSDVFNPANAAPKGEELTAEQIQEMIARGEDPTAVTEATAAGAGAGDEGGSSFVQVDFNNTQGDVTSGFDTLGIPGPESTTVTELPPVEDNVVPLTTIIGSLLEIELDVEAQGIPEGSDVIYTVTLDKVSTGDITVTLSNGAVIVISAGQLSGSSDPIPVQGDDPYVDPSQEAVNIVSMTGGGTNEVLEYNPAPVTFEVIDTTDTTTITLGDVTVDEGTGTATISATVSNAVTGTPLVITLDNSATITIAVGGTSGVSTAFAVQGDDPYVDGESYTVAIDGTSGGNYEALDTSDTATVTINDTINTTTVSITAADVTEDAAGVTFNIQLSNAPQGAASVTVQVGATAYMVNLDAAGAGSLFIATNDPDVYVDPDSITATVTAINGGNFEATSVAGATVTADITDTITPVTVSLSASTVSEGPAAAYTFTATLSAVSHGTTTVVTDKGTITIADGQTTGTLVLGSNGEDVYLDASSLTATITSATGGNFEQINVGTASATAAINDTINTTTVTLSDVTVTEGGSFVYSAMVNNAPQGSNLVITLSNGVSITILAGQSSGSSAPQTAPNAPDGGSTTTIGIASAAGGNYEALNTADTLVLTVNDTAPTPANDSYTVVEGSTLTVSAAAGVLVNDVDGYDGGKTAVAGTLTGSLGGSLVLAADGSFTYVAPVRDHSDAVADSETFTYTMKDADGTERTATVTIGITDTVPTITATTNGVVDNEAGLQVTGTVTATAVDGVDHFDLSSSVAPTGLTYSFSTDGSFLTAKDGTGDTVFTLSVNPDGTYEYTLVKAAPETVAVTPDFDTLNIPNHATSYALTLYTSYNSSGVGIGDPVGTVTFSTATSYLSVSQDGLGVQNNLMNTGEALKMTFDTPVSDATLNIGNFSKGDGLKWTVYDADGTTVLDTGTITVNTNSESINYSFKLSDYGLDANTSFTSLTIESTANSYKFTGFSIEKAVTVNDTTYDFNVVAVDGDGDISNTGSFSVTANGTDDTLMGTSSNDVLNGGDGDDILTGLGGADTFVWNSSDTGSDSVTDFSAAEGDVLNVADLISGGLTMAAVEASGHLQLQFSNGSNVVQTIDLNSVAVSSNADAQTMLTNLLSNNNIVD